MANNFDSGTIGDLGGIPLCKLFYRPVPLNLAYYIVILVFTIAYFVIWVIAKVEPDDEKAENLTQISNIILAGGAIITVFLWAIRAVWNELSFKKKCGKVENVLDSTISRVQTELSKFKPDILVQSASRTAAKVLASQIDKIVSGLPS